MHVQIPSDLGVCETGAQEEEGGLHCPRRDYNPLRFDNEVAPYGRRARDTAVNVARGPRADHPCCYFLPADGFEDNALGVEALEKTGARPRRVRQEGNHGALLLAAAAAEGAVPAAVLRAAGVLGHGFVGVA